MASVFELLDKNFRQLFAADAATIVAYDLEGIVQTLLLLIGNGLLPLLLQFCLALLDDLAAALVGILDVSAVVEHDAPVGHLLMARVRTDDGDDTALLLALQHRASWSISSSLRFSLSSRSMFLYEAASNMAFG